MASRFCPHLGKGSVRNVTKRSEKRGRLIGARLLGRQSFKRGVNVRSVRTHQIGVYAITIRMRYAADGHCGRVAFTRKVKGLRGQGFKRGRKFGARNFTLRGIVRGSGHGQKT